MTKNHDSWENEDTSMNINNDTQHSSMQEHIVKRIPASCEQEENNKQIPTHKNMDKQDERANTQMCYGRISRKQDRLTYD